jgi:hypothetical protein
MVRSMMTNAVYSPYPGNRDKIGIVVTFRRSTPESARRRSKRMFFGETVRKRFQIMLIEQP